MSINTNGISRRQFLSRGAAGAAGMLAAGTIVPGSTSTARAQTNVVGANERINVAVVGIRQRGGGHLHAFADPKTTGPDVVVKTICDIDERLLPQRVKEAADLQGFEPQTVVDMRRVFEDKDIDAVAFATPNHWHALGTIWACQAGKHVYVEKPSCHNIWEGRKMVEAARKYNRIVQVGFQNRSIANVNAAMKFLHEGGIGKVYMARGLCYKPRDPVTPEPNGEVPAGVDYDLWTGPAPLLPFNPSRFHYNWHWQWEYGNGDIGNQGPHQFDIARWGLNKNEHPVKVKASGGYFAFEEHAQATPNTEIALYEYADGAILQFEVRGVYTNDEAGLRLPERDEAGARIGDRFVDGVRIGNIFYGSKGWMTINGSDWKTYFGRKNEPGPSSESGGPAADPSNLAGAGGGGHFGNFVAALRSGKMQDLTCDIEVGHMSTALPHLGNIAYRVGRDLVFDGLSERFIGDRDANALISRDYRKPYVVPDIV